jgi:hypothetical protein
MSLRLEKPVSLINYMYVGWRNCVDSEVRESYITVIGISKLNPHPSPSEFNAPPRIFPFRLFQAAEIET